MEEIGRGKQEAVVLRRRLQMLETKLGERERVKRVRCTDCGRTGLSKKDPAGRDPRRQSEGRSDTHLSYTASTVIIELLNS